MTMPYSPGRALFEGNGTATDFPFSFKVWGTEQLTVTLTGPDGNSRPASGWTARLNDDGGSVTYLHEGAPLPAGWKLAITRNMPFEQQIDLVSGTRFDAEVIETGLDRATAERQQLLEQLQRAVILPPHQRRDAHQDGRTAPAGGKDRPSQRRSCPGQRIRSSVQRFAVRSQRTGRSCLGRSRRPKPGSVMPQTGHEDGLELETDGKLRVRKASASQRGGVLASTTAAANTVPQAGEDGTLDASWVPRPDCWDMFPPFVPVPIWGATPGGSDGRRAVMPGEEQAREEWFLCDGGSDGKDGTVPDLRGRYVRGASEAEPEGTEGGSEDVAVDLSGSTGATTLSTTQMPSHTHPFTAVISTKGGYMESGNLYDSGSSNTSATGGNGSHTHPLSGSVSGTHTDPHLAMNYFIKVV